MNDKKIRKILEQLFPVPMEARCKKIRRRRIGKALVLLKALDKQKCVDCKEEKLNIVAKYFKNYNQRLKKNEKTD